MPVTLHDGSTILLKKVNPDYDPTRRNTALSYLEKQRDRGEIITGLLFIDPDVPDMHAQANTATRPLRDLPFEELNPGRKALAELMSDMR